MPGQARGQLIDDAVRTGLGFSRVAPSPIPDTAAELPDMKGDAGLREDLLGRSVECELGQVAGGPAGIQRGLDPHRPESSGPGPQVVGQGPGRSGRPVGILGRSDRSLEDGSELSFYISCMFIFHHQDATAFPTDRLLPARSLEAARIPATQADTEVGARPHPLRRH